MVCYPALWSALPALGIAWDPSGRPDAVGYTLVHGERGTAVALQLGPDDERPASPTWKWVRRADRQVTVGGDDPRSVEALLAGTTTRSEAVLQFSADLLGVESAAIRRVDAEIAFREEHMELRGELHLRPIRAAE